MLAQTGGEQPGQQTTRPAAASCAGRPFSSGSGSLSNSASPRYPGTEGRSGGTVVQLGGRRRHVTTWSHDRRGSSATCGVSLLRQQRYPAAAVATAIQGMATDPRRTVATATAMRHKLSLEAADAYALEAAGLAPAAGMAPAGTLPAIVLGAWAAGCAPGPICVLCRNEKDKSEFSKSMVREASFHHLSTQPPTPITCRPTLFTL